MDQNQQLTLSTKKFRPKMMYVKKPSLNLLLRDSKKESTIKLLCNLVKIKFNPSQKHAQQFSVKITPEVAEDNYPLVRRILRQLSKELKGIFQPYISSGFSIFSSTNDNDEQMYTLLCVLNDQEYEVEISKTSNNIDLTKINSFKENDIRVKSFIEILIKSILSANKNLIRFDDRSFFDYVNRESLKNGIYKLKGYGTAACITEAGLYLRVNDKSKFISGKSALEKLKEIKKKYQNGDFNIAARDYFQGRSVLAQYGSFRIYKIGDVLTERNVDNTEIPLKQQDGTIVNISLYNYYKQQYKIEIKDRSQPLLKELSRGSDNSDNKNENARFLIPELVYLCGMDDDSLEGIDYKRKISEKYTPQQKLNKIAEINKLLSNSNKKEVYHKSGEKILKPSPKEIGDEWGTNFTGFLSLNGRKLQEPKIEFKDSEVEVQNGRIRLTNLIKAFEFTRDSWICITLRDHRNTAEKNIESIIKSAKCLGINIEKPDMKCFDARNSSQFIEQLREIHFNGDKKIALICLTNHTSNYYPSIKKYLYEQVGIPSQIMNLDKSRNQKLSYFSNVLNQMNVKVRGELYHININNELRNKPSMIIGINSTRIGKKKIKLVMTSSYNPQLCNFLTQFKDSSTEQTEFQSTINSLLSHAIGFFYNKHKRYPEYVIIYRQGGNEKQVQRIYLDELPVFKAFFSGDINNGGYNANFKPKFSIISVNKKSDLKFFQCEDGKKEVTNPPSGTVIDTDVTTPDYFEFYLQAQHVNQGTANPVHFHCIWDTTGMPIEDMENITFNQTFYYWNWNGPIREPAALKFAEVCSQFNAKVKLEGVHEKLMDTPYYI